MTSPGGPGGDGPGGGSGTGPGRERLSYTSLFLVFAFLVTVLAMASP